MTALAPEATRPRVRLEGAAFGYGPRPVLEGVDLAIEDGDFVAVLGHNGSGKTTLLRGLLGLVPPLRGRVHLEGVRYGYVPQRETLDAVFPVTVAEVVRMGTLGMHARGRGSGARLAEAVRRELERVGLEQRAGALFASLSGGQRQRALIARALVARPNLLVLDEPTSGVDAHAAERLLGLLTRLNREERLTVVLVSHQLGMTRSVERVVWVGDGHVQLGSSAEMLAPERLEELFGVPLGAHHAPAPARSSPASGGEGP